MNWKQLIAAGAALFPAKTDPADIQGNSRGQTSKSAATKKSATEEPNKPEPASVTPARPRARGSALMAQLHIAGSDKRAHLAAFAGLSLILLLAFRSTPRHRCVLAALLLGAAIESLQALSITREPEWVDFGYDSAGVLLGTVIALVILFWAPVRSPQTTTSRH